MSTERWSHEYEVTVSREISTVYVINAKDERMAEDKARQHEVAGFDGQWVKRTEEITVEARSLT